MSSIIEKDVERVLSSLSLDEVRGKNVLVTGGAGFIGSWLCDVLVKAGARVVCLDNLSGGRVENINHLLCRIGFKFVNDDVCTFKTDDKYDYILHLASRAAPEEYQRYPIDTLLANSLGSLNMLELARKSDAVVLLASTSEVYGDAEVIPTPESYWGRVNPVGIRSCYDESKRFGEALCMAYFRQYGVDVRIARLFNCYGPRLDPNASYARVVSRFIIQALSGRPITVHGDGRQTRSFLYISDAVNALVRIMAREGLKGEVVNVGSPNEVTILELAELVKKLTSSKSPIEFKPPRPDDPKRRCPDISKAKSLLGWRPKVSLEEGLKLTVAWFKEYLSKQC